MAKKRRNRSSEFKPDPKAATWVKTFRLTALQRLRLTRWLLYVLTIVGCLVVQDVIMSRIRLFGATTDLAVCAIILITILEGTEVGTVFMLIASTCYYFSGSAPGAYVIALLTFLSTGAGMLRQLYWHRSRGSILLFSGITIVLYELGLFVVGVTNGLTIVTHLGAFLLTGFYSVLAMIPLYSLVYKIGLIGGNTWKE